MGSCHRQITVQRTSISLHFKALKNYPAAPKTLGNFCVKSGSISGYPTANWPKSWALESPTRPSKNGRITRTPTESYVCGTQVSFRFGSGAVYSDDRYRCADYDDEDEDEDAECGEGGLATTPAPQPCGWANGPGVNRLAFEEASQFVGKFFRGRVAAGRFLLQAFQTDGLKITRDAWIEQPRRNRLVKTRFTMAGSDSAWKGARTVSR